MHNGQPNRRQREWIAGLLKQHEAALLRYASRLTGDPIRAQDAVQETFMRLCLQDADGVKGHEVAWLYRVCRQRALDARRKENRMQSLDAQESARCESPEAAPEANIEREETTGEVQRLLVRLPERQQEVVQLKFAAGLSYREISEATGLSVSNVGFLLHTALKKIRTQLNRTGCQA